MSFSRIFDPQAINRQPRGRSYSKQVIQQRLVNIPGRCISSDEYELRHNIPQPIPPPPPTPPSLWDPPLLVKSYSNMTSDKTSVVAQTFSAIPTFSQINNIFDSLHQAYYQYTRNFDFLYLTLSVPFIGIQFHLLCRDTAPENETIISTDIRSRKFNFDIVHEHKVIVHGQMTNEVDRVNQAAEYNLNIIMIPYAELNSIVMSSLQQTYGGSFDMRPQKGQIVPTGPLILNRANYTSSIDNNLLYFGNQYEQVLGSEDYNLEFSYNVDSSYFSVLGITVATTVEVVLCGSYRP